MGNSFENFARTKVIWTFSPNFIDLLSDDYVLNLINWHVDAMLTVFTNSKVESYKLLRQNMEKQLNNLKTDDGKFAFLFSLLGRRAFCLIDSDYINVDKGQKIKITCIANAESCLSRKDPIGGEGVRIVASSYDVFDRLKNGSKIFLGYGEVELNIVNLQKESNEILHITAEIAESSIIRTGMDVSSDDLEKGLFPLIEHDKIALETRFLDMADAIIVHGIVCAADLHTLRMYVDNMQKETGTKPLLLLRIDSASALNLMGQVISDIDGVFLNRSELGMSIHPHTIPVVQKDLILQCNKLGKTIVVSSDLLASMRKNPNPTRAEISDLANLVIDGVDAVVLGREITEGEFAQEAATFCYDTIINSEQSFCREWHVQKLFSGLECDALAAAALSAAENVGAKAIVCITENGYTAARLSSLHGPIDVIALTSTKRVMRQTQIMHSVRPFLLEKNLMLEELLAVSKKRLAEEFGFIKGDKLVFVSLKTASQAVYNSNMFIIEEYI